MAVNPRQRFVIGIATALTRYLSNTEKDIGPSAQKFNQPSIEES